MPREVIAVGNARISALDGLRGIAILGVVIYHYGEPYKTYFPSDNVRLYNFPWGEMGVQLFFMISGFVIFLSAIKGKKVKNFVISRFARLYPTYWVSLIVSSILIFSVGIENRTITAQQVLINFSMFQRFLMIENVDQVYWTLGIELQFYILIMFYIALSKGEVYRQEILIGAFIWSLLGLVLCILYPHEPEMSVAKVVKWAVLAEYSSLFSFGIAMFFYWAKRELHWSVPVFVVIAATTSGIQHGLTNSLMIIVIAILFFWGIHGAHTSWLSQGPLNFLGKISYPWYLSHTIIGFVLIHLTHNFLGEFLSVVLAVTITVLWSSILHTFVEGFMSKRLRNYLISKSIVSSQNRWF